MKEKINVMLDASGTSSFQTIIYRASRFSESAALIDSDLYYHFQVSNRQLGVHSHKFEHNEIQLLWVLLQKLAADKGWGQGEVGGTYLESELKKEGKK